jgi:ribosome biogenesis GTPase
MIDIDFELLRHIGLTQAVANQLSMLDLPASAASLVRVTEVHRDTIVVHDGAIEFSARALPRLLQSLAAQDTGIAVGDWMLAERRSGDEAWLSARLEPLTHLARRTADGRRQPLASNIDTALLVMGLDHDFNLRRMERYIALVHAAGVAAVVMLTKADIVADGGARLDQLQQRLPGGVPMFAVNALGDDAPMALRPWLGSGQTLILLGSSGAGKSTLTNTLGKGAQATGGVRQGDSRGRHTTTARSLHLCEGGACIIDTPGLRSLQPDIDEEALSAAFEDIDALAAHCQFRDCGHEAEPGCAVRGAVDPDRVRNYHKLLREARRSQQTPLDRIAERSKWKVILKAANVRARAKRT